MTGKEHKEYLETIVSACCGAEIATQEEGMFNRCTKCNQENIRAYPKPVTENRS